jgi:hypothetical protein
VAIANYYDSGGSTKGGGGLWKKKKKIGEVKMHMCVNMGVYGNGKKLDSIVGL